MVSLALGLTGVVTAAVAVFNERRMQQYRLPGVSYADVTWRRDGGWRRDDLFAPEGLAFQRKASRYGLLTVLCWLLAIVAWVAFAVR
jgi:hypothetical protein